MKVLIDNGHGYNTPGKRSPNGILREWLWTRVVAKKVVKKLKYEGIDAELVTVEDEDIPLKERVRRVNYWCNKLGSNNVCVISIHLNASGIGVLWMQAQGWSVFVSSNGKGEISRGSSLLSECLASEAEKNNRKVRREYKDKPYWVKSLAITRDTKCPAVLTENYFMDNISDYEWLMSSEGIDECIRIHVDAIKNYIRRK